MRQRTVLSVLLVGILALGLTGCDQIEKAIAPAPKITHVTVAAKVAAPGAKTTPALKHVPSHVPLWPDSGVYRTERVTKGSNDESWSTTLSTSDPYQDVVDGTAKGFQDAGWQVMQQDVSSTDASITVLTVSSSSGEGDVTVTAQKDHTTQVGYVVTKPSN